MRKKDKEFEKKIKYIIHVYKKLNKIGYGATIMLFGLPVRKLGKEWNVTHNYGLGGYYSAEPRSEKLSGIHLFDGVKK